MSPLAPFLLLLPLLTTSYKFPAEFAIRDARLQNIIALATAERTMIERLIDIKETDSLPDPDGDLSYFLEFLLADSGFPFEIPVEIMIKDPVERFKVVERYLYDWPGIAELLDYLEDKKGGGFDEVELDVMFEFAVSVPKLPTHADLQEVVREINEVDFEELEVETMNTGNFFVLANTSHALGHVTPCVAWGDAADGDLLADQEPFTIPGEEHWLQLYLVFYECLVRAGDELRAKEVRDEIKQHYPNNKGVKIALGAIEAGSGKMQSRDHEVNACIEETPLLSWCHVIPSRDSYLPSKIEEVDQFTFYREGSKVSGVTERPGDVVLYNSGGKSGVSVVIVTFGTVVLYPGDSLVINPNLIVNVCSPVYGFIEVFSV